jgi:hypothetical protein
MKKKCANAGVLQLENRTRIQHFSLQPISDDLVKSRLEIF